MRATRQRWADGKQPNAAGDIVHLLDAIAKLRADAGLNADSVREIKVSFVERLRGRCCECGAWNELDESAVREVIRVETLGRDSNPASPRTTDDFCGSGNGSSGDLSPAKTEPLPSQYVEGKSPSEFNSQRGVPLKRLQPSPFNFARNLSPMSQ
jgi:hypothetical protein